MHKSNGFSKPFYYSYSLQIGSSRCHYDEMFVCLKPHRGSGPYKDSAGSGFYSVQDYKEILQYAADRHINIIPEITMPGHSRAAVASMVYREYKKNKLNGQGMDTSNMKSYILSDAMPKYAENIEKMSEDALNPCLDSTFDFIEKVVDEIIAMHSGIMELMTFHFGGDMVMDRTWVDTPACQDIAGSKRYLESQNIDSRTSMVRTLTTRLPRMFRTCS